MGSSESKALVSAPTKPEAAIKNSRVLHLIDPRSPSAGIDRTPIQAPGLVSQTSAAAKSECPLAFTDPRSPTVGIARTPVREVMRATVGSFARRLGQLFHNETEGKVLDARQKHFNDIVEEEVFKSEELASTEPLLSPQTSQTFSSLAEHANLLATPVQPPLQSVGGLSPFVLLEKPQVEVEIETEADISLEEAEEARESPLHKRLSMSLITCHEGATSSQIFAEVHRDSTSSPVPSVEVEPLKDGVEHSYALPSVTVEPESLTELSPTTDLEDSPVQTSIPEPEEAEKLSSPEETKELVKESSLPPASASSEPPTVPSPEQPQPCKGIRCPTLDSKSPSQVVFKPQWLGKGFGASGLRARGVQGPGGKGGSSPLAVRVAVKNATNENKGQSGKLKQKGTEGRSPLQILKETNSPRDQRSQMKLKVSTPDKQRRGQMDRRVLAVALDKENR
ncbi:cell division cycle-associated protein 3 [Trachinotus anak]|uniref:cell division cycle-associated protein 3 n=1 Tax=Trachinotus anak TaxID=443729 RepID=UPI0039F1803E